MFCLLFESGGLLTKLNEMSRLRLINWLRLNGFFYKIAKYVLHIARIFLCSYGYLNLVIDPILLVDIFVFLIWRNVDHHVRGAI